MTRQRCFQNDVLKFRKADKGAPLVIDHIGIEYVFKKFPLKAQWILSRVIYFLITAFGLVMIVSGFQLVQYMSMSTLPATKLPSSVKYAVIPLAGITLVYNALELFFVSYQRYMKEGDEITDVVM